MASISKEAPLSARLSIRNYVRAGTLALILLLGAVISWASSASLSSAVGAAGVVVVNSTTKRIQHPTGGVVGEVLVKEGDKVNAGDILVRLDPVQVQATVNIYSAALDELAARVARDEALLAGTNEIVFPDELLGRVSDRRVAALVAGERRQLQNQLEARAGREARFREQIAAYREEMNGNQEQIAAVAKQLDLIATELNGVRELWAKRLVPFNTMNSLERTQVLLEAQRGQLSASIAQVRGAIAEIELKILQLEQDDRVEAANDRRVAEGQLQQTREKLVTARDELARISLTSPVKGTVQNLAVSIAGEVIRAGEPIATVVPAEDELLLEVRVEPRSIEQISLGAPVGVRITAFDQRTTPELDGEIVLIGADVVQDQKSGSSWYPVRVRVPEQEVARLGAVTLKPGMAAEVYVRTPPRPALAMLTKPLRDAAHRAFRGK